MFYDDEVLPFTELKAHMITTFVSFEISVTRVRQAEMLPT